MKSLNEIMTENQSDKASVFTRTYANPKDYCRHYARFFDALRFDNLKVLEIGVGGGESICGWGDYFQMAHIFGVDIISNTNPWDTPGNKDRYTFVQGDQSDPEFWKRFIAENGGDFDIIVDDGSHVNTDIIMTFIALWPHVRAGGFYAIEDLATAYGGDFFVKQNLPNHLLWLKGKVDEVNLTGQIDSLYFSKELCVIRKAL